MTRKTCIAEPHVDVLLQSVCPELFCFHHAGQGKHRNRHCFDLNCLYGSDSALKLFLKINGISLTRLKKELSTIKALASPMGRYRSLRTRTNSMCYKAKQPLYKHKLRARRHTSFNSFVDASGDDDSNLIVTSPTPPIKPKRELRSNNRSSPIRKDSDMWNSGRPKRACIKNKRISADERLVVDNKSYYKVEVLKSKLRSSDTLKDEQLLKKVKSSAHQVEHIENNKEAIKIPSRRCRNTELMQLNNEATNFLFPPKEEFKSEEDTSFDVPQKSFSKKLENDYKAKKHEHEEESSLDSISSETSSIRKRRRLTQAEAFILDNQKYYKFETPGSRLRYQGSYLSPIQSKHNGEYVTKPKKESESTKPKFSFEDIQFSFERVPSTEGWYKTFQRQDTGEELYLYDNYQNPGFYKPFLLPYEMGPLPPLDPRVCYYNYHELKKLLLDDIKSSATTCSTPESCYLDVSKLDDFSSTGEDTKSSEDSNDPDYRKIRPTRSLHSPSKNPRKSPRQHASTLAILSSFIHQRKRKDRRGEKIEVTENKPNLSVISEDIKEEEGESSAEELMKNISNMLNNCEIDMTIDNGVDVHCKPDAIFALDDYIHYKEDYEGPTNTVLKTNLSLNKVNRKKKKVRTNKTGWPNKNKRVFKKEGSDSRDGMGSSEGLANSELENSVTNSPSFIESMDDDNTGLPLSVSGSPKEDNNRKVCELSFADRHTLDKINGDMQPTKLNGDNDVKFHTLPTPKRKEHRESSSENCAEVVIASVGDKIDCVNVGLDEWENAERMLTAKLHEANDMHRLQPIVRVQKLDTETVKLKQRKLVTTKRARPRRIPASPKSPRMLRKPRGKWYRER